MTSLATKGTVLADTVGAAERLEAALGDPLDDARPCSYLAAVRADESERFPEEAHVALRELEFDRMFVPRDYGGDLTSFETFCALFRVVARRDLTATLGHGISFVGSLPVWVSGSESQKRRAAEMIARGDRLAFMLTERDHGSDLQKNELVAQPVEGGYELNGEKWLINNATLSRAFTVVTRSGDGQLSVFFVDKRALSQGAYEPLPKVKTAGVRALDISGISLRQARVDSDSLVGARDRGFEVVLKSLQVSRALCAPLCLGPLDTCLRATVDFALSRVLYGRAVASFPHARKKLTDAFLDALLLDCMGAALARAMHAAPDQLPVWSSVQKYFVPTRAKEAIDGLAVVLGARHYLREEHWRGIFQKMARDVALVALFDGSTVVNLSLLATQLPDLESRRAALSADERARAKGRLSPIFDWSTPLPAFDLGRLKLASERDDIAHGLHLGLEEIRQQPIGVELKQHLAGLVASLLERQVELDGALAAADRQDGRSGQTSPELLTLAERHCVLHAASCAVQTWLRNRQRLDRFFAEGEWLALILDRLDRELGGQGTVLPASYGERTFKRLVQLHTEERQFSLLPIQLGRHELQASTRTELTRAYESFDRLSTRELRAVEERLSAAQN